jgi:hypothetical protein
MAPISKKELQLSERTCQLEPKNPCEKGMIRKRFERERERERERNDGF